MRKLYVTLLVAALSAGAFVPQAFAWGGDGHRTVAAIAMKLLPPEKAAAIDKLLRDSNVDRGFVDAASYADEVIREQDHRHKFSPWHFVDWPSDTEDYSASFCKPDCIINELQKQIRQMRIVKKQEPRALAISWVIHLVGDLHQPMHVADRDDHGGNEFSVTYKGERTCRVSAALPKKQATVELHSVWDDCLVFTLENGRSVEHLADDLRGSLTTYRGQAAASGNVMSWAKETHELAPEFAYNGLSHGDDIDDDYIKAALPVVREQLLKAGIRLAKVIDENF
jgi:nuclease S1